MPRARVKKTKSEHKPEKPSRQWGGYGGRLDNIDIFINLLIFILLPIIAAGFWVSQAHRDYVQFGSKKISIERAITPQEQEIGLGQRKDLAVNKGMLFVFDGSDVRCFWMKDMNFPIDILWLDENEKVLAVKENVSPETYPESFCPQVAAKYVLEVNAGLSRQAGVSIGSQL